MIVILFLGPVLAAFNDFWRMVWEQNTHTIVMVTNLIERSRVRKFAVVDAEYGLDHR